MALYSLKKRFDLEKRKKLMVTWLNCVRDWFPELDRKTYFVPPFHVNKVNLETLMLQHVPTPERGNNSPRSAWHQSVFAMNNTSMCDARSDNAHLMVMNTLQNFSRRRLPAEVMVVLSRYNVANYINKTFEEEDTSTRHGKKRKCESHPSDHFLVPKEDGDWLIKRGIFDFLIIHKHFGFVLIQVKAIGDQQHETDFQTYLSKKMQGHLLQLNRLQKTVEFIISDMDNVHIPIRKVLAFPNVDRKSLDQAVMTASRTTLQTLQSCMSDVSLTEILANCMCQDEVKDMESSDMNIVINWWGKVTQQASKPDPMDDHVYSEIVARFCGPASTVAVWGPWHRKDAVCEVRTISEAAREMKMRYTMRILRQKQLNLLYRDDRLMYLSGPPRSGKTLVLLLKAMEWAARGDTLVVVRAMGNNPGHFISHVLYNQIIRTLKYRELNSDKVHLETIDARTDPREFVKNIIEKYQDGQVHFLIDELWVADMSFAPMTPLIIDMTSVLDKATVTLSSSRESCTAMASVVKRNEMLDNIKKVVEETLKTLRSIKNVHYIAKKLLKAAVLDLLNKVEISLDRLHTAACELNSPARSDINGFPEEESIQSVLKVTNNIKFLVNVILSWLASPILKAITKIVAEEYSDVSLWCAGFWPRMCPVKYEMETFQFSVGCPPHVQRIMEMTETIASRHDEMQYTYVTKSTIINPPLPAEGEFYHLLNHLPHVENVDTLLEIEDCELCARDLADLLLNVFDVGNGELQYRDVLIVGRALLPMQQNSTFLETLRHRGIPSTVVVQGTDDLNSDFDFNEVLVTNTYHGHGLERAIVVFVPIISQCTPVTTQIEKMSIGGDDNDIRNTPQTYRKTKAVQEEWMKGLGEHNQRGLWFVASRCAAKLIMFHV